MSDIPLIQVLPLPSKHLEPSKVSAMKTGLLAWGNRSTAIKYGNKFDVLLICADDFDFTNKQFVENVMQKRADGTKTRVYFLPVSEVAKGPLSYANYLTQGVHTLELAKSNNKIIRKKVSPTKQSNEIIYPALFKKQKVLVVCLAGKNRSTSTLIRFLMLNSLKQDREDEPIILKKGRKRNWRYSDWVSYFSKLRNFEIFPINDVQLTILDNEIAGGIK